VTANATATNNLATAVKNILTWNGGKNVTANGANYLSVNINDSTLNGTPLNAPALANSIVVAAQQLADFQPQVIVSFASVEFTRLIENVEIDWLGAQLPFYLLCPYNEDEKLLQGDVGNLPYTNKRFAGIGVASTTNLQVLKDYEGRFTMAFTGRSDALGQENYYDAMYFAVYSLVAAGRVPNVAGMDISAGMRKLISLTSPAYSVGPGDMGNIQQALGTRQPIDLIGTLGPPDFDTQTGARIGQGDVYCIDHKADAGTPYPYVYDVLRLGTPDGGAAADGGSPFQGT
jgi:hypothetical protein